MGRETRVGQEVSASGYKTVKKWVEVAGGESKRIRMQLVPGIITNSLGMEFVYIEPGTFMMGSPSNEPGRYDDERQHRVTISKPFYIQTTEVTQGQWRKIMGNNPSHFKNCGDDCPVETVSWNDVPEFIRRLNQKERTRKYRLPTEAEWEYACRAGSKTRFCFGNSEGQLDHYAWFGRNSSNKTQTVGDKTPNFLYRFLKNKSRAVGGKKPNAWGLYDMHGNVYEWCQDWKGEYPSNHVTDPTGPSSGLRRVNRGGSWFDTAKYCRSADRGKEGLVAGGKTIYVGFRLARTF